MDIDKEIFRLSNKIKFENKPDDGLIYYLQQFLIDNENDIALIRQKSPNKFERFKEDIVKKFFDKFCSDIEDLLEFGDSEKLATYLTMTNSSSMKIALKNESLLIFKETTDKINNHKIKKNKKSNGCYIATMAYGDYDHPQVMELRKFRDGFLNKSKLGRSFIKLYYKYSPSSVEKLQNKQNINLIIRKGLDQFIKIMKKILFVAFFLTATNLFAQKTDSTAIQEIPELKTTVSQQQQEIETLKKSISEQQTRFDEQKKTIGNLKTQLEQQQENFGNLKTQVGRQENAINQQNQLLGDLQNETKKHSSKIDSLGQDTRTNGQQIVANSKKLSTKIKQTDETVSSNNSKIVELDDSLSKNQLYWIIATLVILILGGLLYWLFAKRMRSNKNDIENKIQSSKTDVETQIKNTKTALEEESVKLDSQLLEIISSQLKIKESESKTSNNAKKDHSLVLKVADEVTRIIMNLEVMDKNIRGYKHLKKYSESILDNLKAYGYEIPQLIGQNYNSGMNMFATLEFDDSIEKGKQIIKRIIRPQVNYNKKMIQAAKVIVAFNE